MTVPRSNISWTDFSGGDANFAIGCTKVSPGCVNCYAEAIIKRAGRDFSQVKTYPEKIDRLHFWEFKDHGAPFRRGPGSRPMCFVVDMGDLFHPAISNAFIIEALECMRCSSSVDWQILTKRPERMAQIVRRCYADEWRGLDIWPNLWFGVTVEDQQRADERIPYLLATPAAVRFLSCEPLLGPLDLSAYLPVDTIGGVELEAWPDWVIVGGESGPKRRPFDVTWARTIRDQCIAADVPVFYKQGAAFRPGQEDLLDGRTWKQFPEAR